MKSFALAFVSIFERRASTVVPLLVFADEQETQPRGRAKVRGLVGLAN